MEYCLHYINDVGFSLENFIFTYNNNNNDNNDNNNNYYFM